MVALGLCVVDELLVVEDDRLRAERTRYHERVVGPGGMASTALAQAARLGCRARLLSAVGDDLEGRGLLRSLRSLGVDTRSVVRDPHFSTSVAHVLVNRKSGARRFIVRDRRALERAAPDFDLAPIRRGSVLLIDGHFRVQALGAARRAQELGVPVVADFADTRPAYLRLLRHVDHPVVPWAFTRAWGKGGPVASLRALAEICPGTPVVTLGRKGSVAWIDGAAVRIPARRVRVKDTTGAGDVFHGGFAAGLALGLTPRAALDLATRAAGQACTALGGTGSLVGVEALD